MEKHINTPKLRYPEFEDEWESKKLEKITNYVDYRGRAPLKTEDGIFLITAKNIKKGYIDYECSKEYVAVDNYLTVMSKGLPKIGDVLFTTEAPMGNVAMVDNENIALAQRVIKFRGNHLVNSTYLLHYMLSNAFQKIISQKSFGTTVQGISGKELHQILISFPTHPEQTKIASFLTTVDDKLQALKKKKQLLVQYKKGVMQKIFSQEIRFKDDNGNDFPEWEEKKLGDCLDYIQPTKYLVSSTEYDNSYSTPVLTAGKTFILGYTNETNGIFENNLPVIIFDDFTTATQFVDFPFKAKSSAMKILSANEGINIKFIYEAMEVMNYEVGGHERHWISKFAHLDIRVPNHEEQTKIAYFLSAIDDKIQAVESQIVKMEVWKKGLLQQMFC
jgi:type I restriction enzyme S subunit